MRKIRNFISRQINGLIELLWLFFMVVVPVCIAFSPFVIAFVTGNWWYLFLFGVTLVAAFVFAKIVMLFYEIMKKL